MDYVLSRKAEEDVVNIFLQGIEDFDHYIPPLFPYLTVNYTLYIATS